MYRESKELTPQAVSASAGTANNITLTGRAAMIQITTAAAIYARLGGTVVPSGSGAKYVLIPGNVLYPMWPKPGETVLNAMGAGTASVTVTVLEIF
jgi:hypothetical protein